MIIPGTLKAIQVAKFSPVGSEKDLKTYIHYSYKQVNVIDLLLLRCIYATDNRNRYDSILVPFYADCNEI